MNKLTAEKCREQFEQWFRDIEAGDDANWSSPPYLSREWHDYLARRQLALGAWNKALELALPILEQQEHEKSIIAGQLESVRDSLSLTPHQDAIISCAIDRLNVLTLRTLELSRSLIKQQEQPTNQNGE